MKKLHLIGLAIVLASCRQACAPDLPMAETLPIIADFERPANAEAADMLEEYLGIMDSKMDLAGKIGRISTRDQYVREVFIDMFSDPDLDPEVRAEFQEFGGKYVEAIDELNTQAFKKIMETVTWRELATGEARLAQRAFHIVQHTNDDAFREATLAEIKPLAEEGLMEGQSYALMFDRVALKKGEMQLYGTQTKCIAGQYDVHDLAEPDRVDERRKLIGMEPLVIYLERNRDHYGPCTEN